MWRIFAIVSACSGASAVLLGAFGAHTLKRILPASELIVRLAWWETASRYHLVHSIFLLVLAWIMRSRETKALVVASYSASFGILVFSGSLYSMTLSGVRWLGAITPIGGSAFVVAWCALAVALWRTPDSKR